MEKNMISEQLARVNNFELEKLKNTEYKKHHSNNLLDLQISNQQKDVMNLINKTSKDVDIKIEKLNNKLEGIKTTLSLFF